MRYWLDLFTPYTWDRFKEHGAAISGFRPRQRKTAYQRIKTGDLLLCYLIKLSRWCGVLEVISEAFEDTTPIFAEANDPFPIRFKVKPIILLEFEQAIPIQEPEIWNSLSFTKKKSCKTKLVMPERYKVMNSVVRSDTCSDNAKPAVMQPEPADPNERPPWE
jgi:predicted RNA-binding protein